MVIGQTKKWELARQNRSKYGYWADRIMGIAGSERIEAKVLTRTNRPIMGISQSDQTQTEKTEIWVLGRPQY